MNGEINIPPDAILKLKDVQEENRLAQQANSVPLPGVLRDAFSPIPEICVGSYRIRPVVDRDFEYLQSLDHPLHKVVSQENGDSNLGDTMRGQPAWEACLMFSKPFKEVKEIIKTKGIKGFKEQAADEFGELGLREIIEIMSAVFHQIEIFWACVIGHKTADDGDSKKNISVDGAGLQPMASAG